MKLGRITGLDPAHPCFYHDPNVIEGALKSLSADDASFVDVIHTNAGQLGVGQRIGHIDFYAGGNGITQDGCSNNIACSHTQAPKLFANTIPFGNERKYEAEFWCDVHDKSCEAAAKVGYPFLVGYPANVTYRRDGYYKFYPESAVPKIDSIPKAPTPFGHLINPVLLG